MLTLFIALEHAEMFFPHFCQRVFANLLFTIGYERLSRSAKQESLPVGGQQTRTPSPVPVLTPAEGEALSR